MILSNVAIQNALDSGRLVIEPQPLPRKPEGGGDCPYQTTSVDLTLGNEISYFPESGLPYEVNLRRGGFAKLFGPIATSQKITDEQPFSLRPMRFILARTHERVALPILSDKICLGARVEGKSSYARCGLLVHFTAPTIHAGFDGTITLELYNMGRLNILLYPGAPICQLIVEEVLDVPFRNDSQFQGQSAPGGRV
jgi:dCTP deaminase